MEHEKRGILYADLLLKSLYCHNRSLNHAGQISNLLDGPAAIPDAILFFIFKPPCGVPRVFQQSLSKQMRFVFQAFP